MGNLSIHPKIQNLFANYLAIPSTIPITNIVKQIVSYFTNKSYLNKHVEHFSQKSSISICQEINVPCLYKNNFAQNSVYVIINSLTFMH